MQKPVDRHQAADADQDDPERHAAVASPAANSSPTASSQKVASLNAWRRGVGFGGSSGAPLRWRRPWFQSRSNGCR